MIFFGSRGKTVSGQLIEGIQCPSCENQQFISFGTIRYFHLYWIPTFPTSKTVGIECTHCKRTLVDKEIATDLSKRIKAAVFTKSNVIPMFSGLILIVCLLSVGVYAAKQDDKQDMAYIEHPSVNDLYIVDFTKIFDDTDPKYKYGVMRLRDITSGQAEFQVSSLAYNKKSGVRKDIRDRKTSSDSYYDSETFLVDIDKLKSMKASRAIDSIERP